MFGVLISFLMVCVCVCVCVCSLCPGPVPILSDGVARRGGKWYSEEKERLWTDFHWHVVVHTSLHYSIRA